MFGRLGIGEIVSIVAVALLIFGPQKLPELGKHFGDTIRSFRDAVDEGADNDQSA